MTSISQRNFLLKILIALTVFAIGVAFFCNRAYAATNSIPDTWDVYIVGNSPFSTYNGSRDTNYNKQDWLIRFDTPYVPFYCVRNNLPAIQFYEKNGNVKSLTYMANIINVGSWPNVNGITKAAFQSSSVTSILNYGQYASVENPRVHLSDPIVLSEFNFPVLNSDNTVSYLGQSYNSVSEFLGSNWDYKTYEQLQAVKLMSPKLDSIYSAGQIFGYSIVKQHNFKFDESITYNSSIQGAIGTLKVYYNTLDGIEKYDTLSIHNAPSATPAQGAIFEYPCVFYRGNRLAMVDMSYILPELPANVTVTKLELNIAYDFGGGVVTPTSNILFDLSTNSIINSTYSDNGVIQDNITNTVNGNSGGTVINNTDNKNALQAIVDWLTSSLDTISTSLQTITNAFIGFISALSRFFIAIGEVFVMVFGSEIGTLMKMSLITVCLIGVIKVVRG